MCVIYACATEIPPRSELARGAFQNSDGAGLAWVGSQADGTPIINWQKGLKDESAVLDFISTNNIKLPLTIHFRTASVGGKAPELTHPFPLEDGANLNLSGSTPMGVLFHNGHVANWEDWTLRAVLASGEDVPTGIWSDSRALAYLTQLKGPGILRFLIGSSRVVLFYPHASPGNPWDHFDFWGSWEDPLDDKQGWLQSIATNHVVTYSRGMGPTAVASACSVITSKDEDLNIWTVEELNEILTGMEKELADARSAAGL